MGMSGTATSTPPLLTLLIDNYDSYTYNLRDLLREETGADPIVIFNNEPWDKVKELLKQVDAVVISPGKRFSPPLHVSSIRCSCSDH